MSTKKVYPKKVKKAYQPMFSSNGSINPLASALQSKGVNPANFTKEPFILMEKNDYEEMRRKDAMNTISW